MTVQNKKIVSLEILHLDDQGYGPEGKHTRREWRDECKTFLTSDPETFRSWQMTLHDKKPKNSKAYGVKVVYENQESTILHDHQQEFCLDFVATNLESEFEAIQNCEFHYHANFSFSKFSCDIKFYGCRFYKTLNFEHAVFLQTIEFQNCQFQELNLSSSVINSFLQLSNSTLQGSTDISNSQLRGLMVVGTVFEGLVIFSNSQIYGMAHFDNSSFYKIFFDNTSFHLGAVFKKAKFHNVSSFRFVNFLDSTDFENAEFNCVGHFEGATFNSYSSKIPTFRGCKIDSTRLEFSDDSHFTQNDYSEDAIKNISFLKRLADEHGQTDQALNFNAMELRAKHKAAWQRLLPKNREEAKSHKLLPEQYSWRLCVYASNFFRESFWFCVFTYLYEKLSDFGRSFTKPLFYLFALIVISYLFGVISAFENSPAFNINDRQPIFSELSRRYIFDKSPSTGLVELSGYRAAMEYSLYRSANFIDFADNDKNTASINIRLFGSNIEPWWARLFGLLKGIATAVLLFLIALGLRNKYRVG